MDERDDPGLGYDLNGHGRNRSDHHVLIFPESRDFHGTLQRGHELLDVGDLCHVDEIQPVTALFQLLVQHHDCSCCGHGVGSCQIPEQRVAEGQRLGQMSSLSPERCGGACSMLKRGWSGQ